MPPDDPVDRLKRQAAEQAVRFVEAGMVLGLGTGSTAFHAVEEIGRRVRAERLDIVAIPTSEATAAQARRLGIRLVDFSTHRRVDLTIDGADVVDRETLTLIKGLGGALLREKIVASASQRMMVIADESKLTGLAGRCRVPVEIVRFGWQATLCAVAALGCTATLRRDAADAPFVTDGGNHILDCDFAGIPDAARLEHGLKRLVGVVETGLFIGLASEIIVASAAGIEIIRR